jgi:hypothetical protein
MFPIHGLERVSNWLRGVSEPFARPLSARALRIILIAGPGVVLIAKGPFLTLIPVWSFTIWILPVLYNEVLRSRALHHEAIARAWAAEFSLRQAAAQRLSLERELQRRCNLDAQLQAAQSSLQEANEEILKVTIALREAEDDLRKERNRKKPDSTAGTPNPIFRRVGLDEKCPDFVLKAVRTAYRRALHPDTQPDARKAEATRRFQDSEAAFDEIYRLRGLQQ